MWASVGADAQRLPFRSGSFDGVTICYGIRNVEDRPKAYREFLRVLRPQGQLTILEFSRPRRRWLRSLYDLYSLRILPRIGGWISGSREAYSYLPASIRTFPDQPALAAELRAAGFQDIRWTDLTGGIVALHTGRKPGWPRLLSWSPEAGSSFTEPPHIFRGAAMSKPDPSITADLLSKLPTKKTDCTRPPPFPARTTTAAQGPPAPGGQGQLPFRREELGAGPTRTSNRGK